MNLVDLAIRTLKTDPFGWHVSEYHSEGIRHPATGLVIHLDCLDLTPKTVCQTSLGWWDRRRIAKALEQRNTDTVTYLLLRANNHVCPLCGHEET